jgi:integral membrane protein
VRTTLKVYRVLATVVGISLIILFGVALPLDKIHNRIPGLFPEGSHAQQLGGFIGMYLGTAHGFIFMGFVIVAFVLSRQARWDVFFTLVTLLCGTIPIVSFWAEHRATQRVRAQLAEEEPLASTT